MNSDTFIALNYVVPDKETLVSQSGSFYPQMKERRSSRHFPIA